MTSTNEARPAETVRGAAMALVVRSRLSLATEVIQLRRKLASTPDKPVDLGADAERGAWFKRNGDRRNPKAFINTDPLYFAEECASALVAGTLTALHPASVDATIERGAQAMEARIAQFQDAARKQKKKPGLLVHGLAEGVKIVRALSATPTHLDQEGGA